MRLLLLCAGVLVGCSDRRAPWANAPDTTVTAPRDSGDRHDGDHDRDHEKGKKHKHPHEDAARP